MKYINKQLKIEKVKVQDIAKKFGTPIYCYSYKQLKENIGNFKKNFRTFNPLICFAVKSNTNVSLIREIGKLGLGADVVCAGNRSMALLAAGDELSEKSVSDSDSFEHGDGEFKSPRSFDDLGFLSVSS